MFPCHAEAHEKLIFRCTFIGTEGEGEGKGQGGNEGKISASKVQGIEARGVDVPFTRYMCFGSRHDVKMVTFGMSKMGHWKPAGYIVFQPFGHISMDQRDVSTVSAVLSNSSAKNLIDAEENRCDCNATL